MENEVSIERAKAFAHAVAAQAPAAEIEAYYAPDIRQAEFSNRLLPKVPFATSRRCAKPAPRATSDRNGDH
jgi:hypothetical protein